MNPGNKRALVYLWGTVDGVHQQIWEIRKDETITKEQERELDSAQVFLEAAAERMERALYPRIVSDGVG